MHVTYEQGLYTANRNGFQISAVAPEENFWFGTLVACKVALNSAQFLGKYMLCLPHTSQKVVRPLPSQPVGYRRRHRRWWGEIYPHWKLNSLFTFEFLPNATKSSLVKRIQSTKLNGDILNLKASMKRRPLEERRTQLHSLDGTRALAYESLSGLATPG